MTVRNVRYEIETGIVLDAVVVRAYKTTFEPRDASGKRIPDGEYLLDVVDLVAVLPSDLPDVPGVTADQRDAGFLHVKAVLEGRGLYRWHDPVVLRDVPAWPGADVPAQPEKSKD